MRIAFHLSQKMLVLIAVPLLFQFLFVFVLLQLLKNADAEINKELQAKEIISQASILSSEFFDVGFSLGGYSMTRTKWSLDRYQQTLSSIQPQLTKIHELVEDIPDQNTIVQKIDADWIEMQKTLEFSRVAIEEVQRNTSALDQVTLFVELKKRRAKLINDTNQLIEANRSIALDAPRIKEEARKSILITLFAGVSLSTALTIWLAFFFNSETKGKLRRLSENTVKLASGVALGQPLQGDDEISVLDQTFHEMAEQLEESRRKEQDIVTNARDIICSVAENGKFAQINAACESHWGYKPEDLLGRGCLSVIVPEERDVVDQAFKQVRRTSGSASIESQIICNGPNISYALWSVRWSAAQKAFHCVVHDITERKELEKLKQEFVAMVSHDLRSPLTAIQGTLYLLRMGAFDTLSAGALERVNRMEESTTRLIHMVTRLLDIERMEAGLLELEWSKVSVDELVQKSTESVRNLFESKGQQLNYAASHLTIYADEERLIQVLINLLSNAIKFSPNGSAITVHAVSEQSWVEIGVRDRGRGVAPEQQELIFQRFKQSEKSDSTEKKGFGLGLPICKIIVEKHGGTIGVTSEKGQGSVFWIRIPIRKSEE